MSDEKDHARQRPAPPPEPKSPSSLPGPNRFPDKDRYGEALAPGTVPDEEREAREKQVKKDPSGIERP